VYRRLFLGTGICGAPRAKPDRSIDRGVRVAGFSASFSDLEAE
jgi:hypothetical protein